MGLFDKLKAGLQKTHSKLVHEIKRIVTDSPKLTGTTFDELEAALLGADLGLTTTRQIVAASPSIRVVLMSTYQADDLPADALDCGAAAYVRKEDLTPRVLREVVAGG